MLLGSVSPWTLAGILYLGSGLGLSLSRLFSKPSGAPWPERGERRWLVGAIASGGVAAPVLLMLGLTHMPASSASLLLNAEGVLTALLAWFVFKENFDRRIASGMLAILAGAVVLSWPREMDTASALPALAIVAACLCWAIDNNLTRKISLMDAVSLASIKGLVAGSVNLSLAFVLGAQLPAALPGLGAMVVGFFAYGVSLVLFITGLRNLGTARAGAYFSAAPFFGAVVSIVLLGEPISGPLLLAGLLMGIGVWLHLTEQHSHEHAHSADEHEHEHVHDGDVHHAHEHQPPVAAGTRHSHRHQHAAVTHEHDHVPDAHHHHTH